jgi:hypothetical protein
MEQTGQDTAPRVASAPPRVRRFAPRRDERDERHRTAAERRADARRQALVSAWLRRLSHGD